jgi:hypothetical protein
MTWKPIPNSAKSLLEGVEFGMTDGATTCLCSISQQEIDKWADHIGKDAACYNVRVIGTDIEVEV